MDGTPLALVNNGTVCYPHPDRLGTVQRITDAGQQVVWSARYEPFGQAVIASGIEYNPRFPGQYYDAETGLNYNHFRDYDAAGVGRYVESDPVGLIGGINTYGYVENNPVRLIDPLGLEICIANGQSIVCTDGMRPPPDGTPLEGPLSPLGILKTVLEGGLSFCPLLRSPNINRLPSSEIRKLYNEALKMIDTSGPLTREMAERVQAERNVLKQLFRDLMSDRAAAEQLAREQPLQPLDYYIEKYSAQGFEGEDLWRRII